MRFPLPSLLFGLLPLVNSVNGYFIDDDCSAPQKQFLRNAINNAFMLNNGAMAAEGSPNAATTQVLEWLFGTDEGTRRRLRVNLKAMSDINTEHASAAELGRTDFHVYCTDKRFKTTMTAKGLKRYDPDMQENWRFRTEFNCAVASAYTVKPAGQDKPSAIQICPWFLDYVMSKDPAFQNEIESGTLTKLAVALREYVANTKYAEIDLVGLIDKVMLHEITHTRAGGPTIDIGGFSGYGWANCRKLSTLVTSADGKTDGPERNADSVAIFASVVRMINSGAVINEDGTFTPGGATRIKRAIAGMRTRGIFH